LSIEEQAMSEHSPQPNEIARLNDEFRRTTRELFLTQGIQALPDIHGLVTAIRQFNTFTPDNDPYGEHDFGVITWHNERTYWKIDYYDQQLQNGCEPLSPECRRVLTVLLASEY
jgi:hypothetical protein